MTRICHVPIVISVKLAMAIARWLLFMFFSWKLKVMKCLNPIRIKNPAYPETSTLKYIDCACRKCFNCLVNIRRMWYFRLFYESLNCKGNSYFIGLDYAPSFCDMNLHKDHLQKFFKKLRKRGMSFTYYAIGEFGTSEKHTHRPHYHALIFFNEVYSREYVEFMCALSWHFGRVDVGYVEPASINYVLHYHVRPKKPFGDDDPRETFCVMSKGLGLSFLEDNYKDIFAMLVSSTSRKVTNPFGESFVLPRYYVRKLMDFGLDVKEFDGSEVDWSQSNLRTLVQMLDPEIEFYSDGHVKEIYDERWESLVRDILKESKRKLEKYDTQDKFSV